MSPLRWERAAPFDLTNSGRTGAGAGLKVRRARQEDPEPERGAEWCRALFALERGTLLNAAACLLHSVGLYKKRLHRRSDGILPAWHRVGVVREREGRVIVPEPFRDHPNRVPVCQELGGVKVPKVVRPKVLELRGLADLAPVAPPDRAPVEGLADLPRQSATNSAPGASP